MSYIDRNLLADEKVVFRTRKHIIIFFIPVVWTIFSYYAGEYLNKTGLLSAMEMVPWIIALVLWLIFWIQYASSEFAVTNKRVMMREGFFTRHTNETRLTSISQVNVDQSLLGQLMNYGSVSINSFGAFDAFTLIASPNTFQRYVNQELDKAFTGKTPTPQR